MRPHAFTEASDYYGILASWGVLPVWSMRKKGLLKAEIRTINPIKQIFNGYLVVDVYRFFDVVCL